MQKSRQIEVLLGKPRAGEEATFATVPPTVHVRIGYDPDWPGNGLPFPRNNGITYSALIDTGAEATVIRPNVATQIGIAHSGQAVAASSFGGTQTVNTIHAQIYFPHANIVFPAHAALIDFPGHNFDAVLGRSFLRNCKLCVNGLDGTYSLAWVADGVPSSAHA